VHDGLHRYIGACIPLIDEHHRAIKVNAGSAAIRNVLRGTVHA
jgi:hypothetical protein